MLGAQSNAARERWRQAGSEHISITGEWRRLAIAAGTATTAATPDDTNIEARQSFQALPRAS